MADVESKVPKDIHDLVEGFLKLRGEPHVRENEVNVLQMLIVFGEDDLAKGTSPNPGLLVENLKWFRLRLDELGAGKVRA